MELEKKLLSRPRLGLLKEFKRSSFVQQNYQDKIHFSNVCKEMEFFADDLCDEGEIGRGAFGVVNRMVHKKKNSVMAVKRIRSTLNELERKQTLKDLDVVMHSKGCPNIVKFYGAVFKEGECWICMEMMDSSLDKFYKFVYHYLNNRIPEKILGKISGATISALNFLKVELKVIHRDVKPSNILIDRQGRIKLCDFGISGQLVDSIAKSCDAGCRPYMAPERINPGLSVNGYDIRSDVWSFGLTLFELATGRFPYAAWTSVFEQIARVLNDESPRLPQHIRVGESEESFSGEFRDFVAQCLQKDVHARPKYPALMNHPFSRRSRAETVDVGGYFCSVLDQVPPELNLDDFLTRTTE